VGGLVQHRHVETSWGLAVVALVMAASYQPAFLLYPAQALAAALVFFVAGCELVTPIIGQAPTSLLRLAGVAYGGTTVATAAAGLLARAGVAPGGPIPSFATAEAALDAARAVLLSPLGLEEAPVLFPAAWVLVAIALARAVLAGAAAVVGSFGVAGAGFLGAVAALAAAAPQGAGSGVRLFVARTAFAVAFCALGRLVHGGGEPTRRRLRAPVFLALGFLAVDALAAGGGLRSRIDVGALGPAALLTMTLVVLMAWSLASYAAEVVPTRSALLALGRSWVAVIAGHAAVVFLVEHALVRAGALPSAALTSAFPRPGYGRVWLLCLVPALAAPVILARVAAVIRLPTTVAKAEP
jgi:hypothetical protein